ncbi:MAG: hypothetical protein M3548_04610 [Actinomycetota bacterium]|nr:hypothetical protein [Actinomycetota bacterium]
MRKLLCQVCAGPADRNADGILWVLKDHHTDWPDWPNRMGVTEPPICAACLDVSVRACPALRKGHAVIRARTAPTSGVHGTLYGPSPIGPQPVRPILTGFDGRKLRWVIASHLVRELQDAVILNQF